MNRSTGVLLITLALTACATLTPAPTQAGVLFSDNFQTGAVTGWTTTGTVAINSFSGNYSMRLTGAATSRRTISTSGQTNVAISLQMAKNSLEAGETCVAEVSLNGGTSYTAALTLTSADTDDILYGVSNVTVNADNNANFVVRFRGTGGTGDFCYADNIVISAAGAVTPPSADSFQPLAGSGVVSRSVLTAATLNRAPTALTNFSAFALPATAAEPTNIFQGKLTLFNVATAGGFAEVTDTFNYTGAADDPRKHLLPFDFEFVQTGSHLFPVQRGSIASTHDDWEFVLSPGRVWNETTDGGFTRAAIPFALQQKNANCVHNGVLMFLYKSNGAISNVQYQIASETCLYYKVNMYGMVGAAYSPYAVTNAASLKTAYQSEVTNRIPTYSLANIGTDYPGVVASKLAAPNGTVASHITMVGLYLDGKHYVGSCTTRQGEYPYCESLVVPSYSTAKSAFAGVSMMRLEKKYAGAKDAFASTWVPTCASSGTGTWSDVKLNNLLDMSTGNYTSSAYMTDENNETTLFDATTAAAKISRACTAHARKVSPGGTWVYHTSDTYVAGTLMNAYLKSAEGSTKDLFTDLLVGELYGPIGVSPTAKYTRRTYDATAQPFTGWGLIWNRDDVAKIGKFIGIDDGVIGGTAMLDTTQLNGAMQRSAADRGTTPLTDYKYNNGFWAYNVKTGMSCANDTWIPFMSGYGGITILLLPNDMVYYYFSDNDTYLWLEAAQEAAKIRPICN